METCTKAWTANDKPDEFEVMGIDFAAKLKKMATTQLIFAEFLIQKVLMKSLQEKRFETTSVVDTSSRSTYNFCYNAANCSPFSHIAFIFLQIHLYAILLLYQLPQPVRQVYRSSNTTMMLGKL
jgi:hypothetical protein